MLHKLDKKEFNNLKKPKPHGKNKPKRSKRLLMLLWLPISRRLNILEDIWVLDLLSITIPNPMNLDSEVDLNPYLNSIIKCLYLINILFLDLFE